MSFDMDKLVITYKPELYPKVSDADLDYLNDNFRLVGSRAIVSETELKHNTDYDYMGCYSESTEHDLIQMGYSKHMNLSPKYLDVSTEVILHKPFIQIVLKKPEHWENCNKLWGLLEHNPNLYRKYLWKSNPIDPVDRSTITDTINMFLIDIIPFVKV